MYRMVIADDDKIERDGIKYLIAKYKYPLEVAEAKHGRAALDLLKSQEADVLLTDIKMPFMDGLQLAKEARALQPQLKIVILSGHGEFEYARTAISLQVSNYLLKPIEPGEFQAAISSLLQQLDNGRSDQRKQPVWPAAESQEGDEEAASHRRAIEEVLRVIEKEYGTDLNLEYLSSRVHLSASYLSHLFKKATGVSVIKYINQYRMEQAKLLLDERNYKINEVFKMVGFSDLSYFGMTFKQYYGVTPTQYREKVRTP